MRSMLTERNVNNISTLIHFMDGLKDAKFTMQYFQHECGSPACALGWAATIPELKAVGLISPQELTYPFAMAREVFGSGRELFSASISVDTPQQWADHARAFLKSQGHKVTPRTAAQADDFTRFMDAVLRPVNAGVKIESAE